VLEDAPHDREGCTARGRDRRGRDYHRTGTS
jgi:hypothetical protein